MNFEPEHYIFVFFIFMLMFYKIIARLCNLVLKQMEYEMEKQMFYKEMFDKDLREAFDRFIEERESKNDIVNIKKED